MGKGDEEMEGIGIVWSNAGWNSIWAKYWVRKRGQAQGRDDVWGQKEESMVV